MMRQSLQMEDGRILIAVAWITNEEKRLFELFPEVLKADVTSQTNKEKRPLFLVVGKDSHGKTFTVLRCFMPSEQKWIFQWLWETAIPILVRKSVLRRNVMLLTDGDFNEYEPFVNARNTLYPHSQHGLCCYHLINQAMSKKLGLCLSHLSEKGKELINIFTDWVHSWTNEVETMPEYQLSKDVLDSWFKSLAIIEELKEW
jgi:MULE transposase domain